MHGVGGGRMLEILASSHPAKSTFLADWDLASKPQVMQVIEDYGGTQGCLLY